MIDPGPGRPGGARVRAQGARRPDAGAGGRPGLEGAEPRGALETRAQKATNSPGAGLRDPFAERKQDNRSWLTTG